MIPILSAQQIREADAYTILNEPISSIDLMERASNAFVKRFLELTDRESKIRVFCGIGNNGGDGLAVSRILIEKGYQVNVYTVGNYERASEDFLQNLTRIEALASIRRIETELDFPQIDENDFVIDAIFGSGLSRPVEGLNAQLILYLNESQVRIVSIDIASGLFADKNNADDAVIAPWATIAFETPKWIFFQPSASPNVGNWFVEKIGLDASFIKNLDTDFFYTEPVDIISLLKPKSKFSHKGDAGRMLLVAGSRGKMGAAIMASKAALRSGLGLLSVHSPQCGLDVLQTSVPEAMVSIDKCDEIITKVDLAFPANAIGIGPGIGTEKETAKALQKLLESHNSPIVFDADAINILAMHHELIALLPKHSILTPHPGEFKRLVGEWKDDLEKISLLKNFCHKHTVNMVLKGAFSLVCNTVGKIFFNPSGNPGMATAGSGDVLTGIVSSFLAQGYEPENALKVGVYVHGLAGDLARDKLGELSLMASDIIDHVPSALISLENQHSLIKDKRILKKYKN